jgi:hypothetical protein
LTGQLLSLSNNRSHLSAKTIFVLSLDSETSGNKQALFYATKAFLVEKVFFERLKKSKK